MAKTAKTISSKTSTPFATTLLIAVSGIGIVIGIVGGLSILYPGTVFDELWKLNPTSRTMFVAYLGKLSGVMLLCLSSLALVTGYGLLKRQKWSWWVALLLLIIVAGVNISRLFAGDPGEFFGTPLTLYLLWLHTRPNVRNYFAI